MAKPLERENGIDLWVIVLGGCANGETWIGRAKNKEAAIAALQSEIPTYAWDRIPVKSIHRVFGEFGTTMKVKNGVKTDFTGLPINPFDPKNWEA
jgi:hypothetical protein